MQTTKQDGRLPVTPAPERRRPHRWLVPVFSTLVALLLAVVVVALIASRSTFQSRPGAHLGATSTTSTTATPNPQENLYLVLNAAQVVKFDTTTRRALWTFNGIPPYTQGNHGAMLVGDGTVYLTVGAPSSNGTTLLYSLYAVNATNGTLRWHNTSLLVSDQSQMSLLLGPGVVYVTAGTDVYALNASDGSVRWHTPVGGSANALGLAQGVLYGTTFDAPAGHWASRLFALTAATGTLLWQTAKQADVLCHIDAVVNGTLYLDLMEMKSLPGGELSAWKGNYPTIDLVAAYSLTGQPLWQSQAFGSFGSFEIEDGIIYLSGQDASAHIAAFALSAKDGTLLWDYPVETRVGLTNPVIASGTVYLGSYSTNSGPSYLIALDGQTGHVQWKHQVEPTAFDFRGWVGGNGFLYSFSREHPYSPFHPISHVEAFNASDGSFAWQASVPGDPTETFIAAP